MKYKIKNRWMGQVIYSADAESLRATVEKAIRENVSLSDSDLRDSDLRGSDLRGSDLRDSDLRGSDLRGSDLRGSDLRGSDLRDSDLRGSDLRGSDLRDSDLRGSDLTSIKADFFLILLYAQLEIPGLKQAVIEGRIDGSAYTGECACLIGTIGKVRGCNYNDLPNIEPNASRPAESFFLGIRTGDTPETCQQSKIVLEWIEEFQVQIGQPVSA